ncbi:MAG: hypothetical protein WCO63_01315 [Bacteroidota bacterium]
MSSINVPSPTKGISYAIWAVIIALVGIYAVRRIIKLIDDMKARKAENDLINSINPAALTFPATQYSIFADELAAAFDGLGTDNTALNDVMEKMGSNSDVLQLMKAFGTRESKHSANFGLTSFSGNLTQQISNELSSGEKEKLNAILTVKGITVTF